MQGISFPPTMVNGPFQLRSDRLGPLPIVNHFLRRMGLVELLDKHVPTCGRRSCITHATSLSVLLRSIVVEREPIYRQQETVLSFTPSMYGITDTQARALGDDRIGRALDELFEADRAVLLTDAVVAMARSFELQFERLHNDSTTVRFCGQYRSATGYIRGGRRTPWITYGYSKDHRPDLKQLLFCLTTSSDGGVPVQFRCYDGNVNDTQTHIQTWETLRSVAGRNDFLYVADSKLCARECTDHIHLNGGRFVAVMPRSRMEDAEFRKWIQANQPQWEKVWDRPNPRRRYGPRDRWFVFPAPLPSKEGWPVIWVYSSLLALRQEHTRREHIAAAIEELGALNQRLHGPKSRLRKASEVDDRVNHILQRHKVSLYLKVVREQRLEHSFRQTHRGRPRQDTAYRRITRRRWQLSWSLDTDRIEYDHKSDGMYPLLTNDRTLAPAAVLQAHKGQPAIEKRFEQTKTVHEIAPVFLKKPERIEALFTLYFLGLLLQTLIERQLRQGMQKEGIEQLPIYPEQRLCAHPTTEQILGLFTHTQQHALIKDGRVIQVFPCRLTNLQKQVLELLEMPVEEYRTQA